MSEVISPRLPLRYDARGRISAFFMDANTTAHPVVPRSAEEGFWPTRSSDPQHAAKVFKADSADNDRSGGDIPFPAVLDGMALNTVLGDQPEEAGQRLVLSILNDCYRGWTALGRNFAVAAVSPVGGFQHERFEQASEDLDLSRLPAIVPPPLKDIHDATRVLHVATISDRLLPSDDQEAQDNTRSLLGAMAAYHALRYLNPDTPVQYAYLGGQPGGTYRAALSQAMGLESDVTTQVEYRSNLFVVSQGTVGTVDQEGSMLHSLAAHIEQTHSIS